MGMNKSFTDHEAEVQWLNEEEFALWQDWLSLLSKFPTALNRQLMEDSDLTLADYEVLVRLSEAEDRRMRVAALAQSMRWERSRLSHQVGRMIKRDLLEKESCAEDGRGAWVSLTDVGRAALEKAAPGHVQIVRELLIDVLDGSEKKGLAAALRSIVDAVDRRLEES